MKKAFRRAPATAWMGLAAWSVVGVGNGCGDDSTALPLSSPDAARPDVGTGPGTADATVADTGSPDSGTADSGRDAADANDAADSGAVYASCLAAHQAFPAGPSGVYMIDPDGAGAQPALSIYCDMTTDGGGWTLGLLRNSVDPGSYPTFGMGYVNTAALATDPKVAGATTPAPPALAGWLDLNNFTYTNLVLEGIAAGESKFRSVAIAKSTLRIQFGQNGYLLYNDANGYYWCGGTAAYTTDGIGQVNKPSGAPDDCKGHTSLGAGWDFGGSAVNTNLTACGGGSALMKAGPATTFLSYPNPGQAHAIWVR
jgi:hypothetical protein